MEAPTAIIRPTGRSQLDELLQPDSFLWATGIEDTFIVDPHRHTNRLLDEYELTGHYTRWREDIDLIASLGVGAARYGIPWYRVQPEPDRWDWSWADQAIEYMAGKGVSPIVDLVHYGVPVWLERSLLNPDFPVRAAEFAARLSQRYRRHVRWFTPLNEPRITAWYCGKIGWWPPYARGWTGFAQVLANVSKAIVTIDRAVHDVDPENVALHVEATDVYTPADPSSAEEADLRTRIGFLSLDMATGRLCDDSRMCDWLTANGVPGAAIDWFGANRVVPDIVGLNLYPMFSDKVVVSQPSGAVTIRQRYAAGDLVERIGLMYHERYARPMMISETASTGSPEKRVKWLLNSLSAVRSLRQRGVPMVGYTWWPLYSLVRWAYRQGTRSLEEYMLHMGLWDLDEHLDRHKTVAADAFAQAVSQGAIQVGRMTPREPAYAV